MTETITTAAHPSEELHPEAVATGVTLKAYLVDAFGKEHVTVTHTSIPASVLAEKGAVIRRAIEGMYAELGMQLVSLVREVEEPHVIEERADPAAAKPTGHLRLVASGGRRVMSPEVKTLMASAGVIESEARATLYGEVP